MVVVVEKRKTDNRCCQSHDLMQVFALFWVLDFFTSVHWFTADFFPALKRCSYCVHLVHGELLFKV